MMTAVMMKADTRPARRGSNVGESWTTVVSPPTLSCEGLSARALAWAVGLLVGRIVDVWWSTLFSGRWSGCNEDDLEVGGSLEELVLDVVLDWVLVVVVMVVVEAVEVFVVGDSDAGAEGLGMGWFDSVMGLGGRNSL